MRCSAESADGGLWKYIYFIRIEKHELSTVPFYSLFGFLFHSFSCSLLLSRTLTLLGLLVILLRLLLPSFAVICLCLSLSSPVLDSQLRRALFFTFIAHSRLSLSSLVVHLLLFFSHSTTERERNFPIFLTRSLAPIHSNLHCNLNKANYKVENQVPIDSL